MWSVGFGAVLRKRKRPPRRPSGGRARVVVAPLAHAPASPLAPPPRGGGCGDHAAQTLAAAVTTRQVARAPGGVGIRSRWLSTTAAATSLSLRPLRWEWSRSRLEGGVGADRVPRHEDALRLLDHRTAPEGTLQALVLGEALQRDVDRALQLVGAAVDDVREDAALGGLVDVGGIVRVEDRDHRAGGLAHDLRDQLQRVLRARVRGRPGRRRGSPGRSPARPP